ncbi:conserved hypothetical protein [Perkinsus marinus ATCC 50983]|uniref:Uncharacterized protein n=1 Tax=Perkinsus marinus (strain ATCC 50983 / TXsc) TaxID=423536 RepID=C5LIK9_PERM5|nr:conserved hypothetical protein [Perkinsus marinus ATCC 50983]EER03412.1 conserved hypothetical protein [Perkinsus marinus ATCC 50983]|eukprot:XP_002771596.1 conserved hypothetical protein [Perkinsus marinus ATCC 50983]
MVRQRRPEEAGKDHQELKQEYEREKALRRLQRDQLKAFPENGGGQLYGLSPLPQPFALPEVMTKKPSYHQLQPPPAPPSPPACFNTYRMEIPPAILFSSPFTGGGHYPQGPSGYSVPPGINPMRHHVPQPTHYHNPNMHPGPRLPPMGEGYRPHQWEVPMDRMPVDQVARQAMAHYHHQYQPMPIEPYPGPYPQQRYIRQHYPHHGRMMPMRPVGYPQQGPAQPMPANWSAVPHSQPLNSNAPPFVQTSRYHPPPPTSYHEGPLPPPPGIILPPQPPPVPPVAPPVRKPGPAGPQEPDSGLGILWEERQRTPPSPMGRVIYLDVTGRKRLDEEDKYSDGRPKHHSQRGFFCPLREHLSITRVPSLVDPQPLKRDGVGSLGCLPKVASPVWQSVRLLGEPTTATIPLDEVLIAPLEPLMPPEMFDEKKEKSELYLSSIRSKGRYRKYLLARESPY